MEPTITRVGPTLHINLLLVLLILNPMSEPLATSRDMQGWQEWDIGAPQQTNIFSWHEGWSQEIKVTKTLWEWPRSECSCHKWCTRPQPPMKSLPINTCLHTTTSTTMTGDLLFVVSPSPPLHTNASGRVVESWLRQEHYAIDIQVSLFLGCLDFE